MIIWFGDGTQERPEKNNLCTMVINILIIRQTIMDFWFADYIPSGLNADGLNAEVHE